MEEPILITEEMLDRRIDFEKKMKRFPRFSVILIALNLIFFIVEILLGSLKSKEAIISIGALYRPLVLKGEWWRIFSSMFLHGGFDHLLGNCIVLYILGMVCEYAYGVKQFILLYFLSGISGAIFSLLTHTKPVVGASGAIFGLLSCSAFFFYKYKDKLILKDKRIGFVLASWGIYGILSGFFVPFIDNFAHIGGALGGILVGNFLKPKLFLDSNTSLS